MTQQPDLIQVDLLANIFTITSLKCSSSTSSPGTPLQFVNRDKSSSACRSIGDSIKKHIFHKALHKTPKRDSYNTPSSSSVSSRTPLTLQVSTRRSIAHKVRLNFRLSLN